VQTEPLWVQISDSSGKLCSRIHHVSSRCGFACPFQFNTNYVHISTMAEDQQQFLHLLSTLLSTDNTIRSNAEVSIYFITFVYTYERHRPLSVNWCETAKSCTWTAKQVLPVIENNLLCLIWLQTTLDGIPVETRATYLLASMRNTTVGEDVRQMAAVLLRRVISNEFEDFYNKVCIPLFTFYLLYVYKKL
jgi:hypothetical protein